MILVDLLTNDKWYTQPSLLHTHTHTHSQKNFLVHDDPNFNISFHYRKFLQLHPHALIAFHYIPISYPNPMSMKDFKEVCLDVSDLAKVGRYRQTFLLLCLQFQVQLGENCLQLAVQANLCIVKSVPWCIIYQHAYLIAVSLVTVSDAVRDTDVQVYGSQCRSTRCGYSPLHRLCRCLCRRRRENRWTWQTSALVAGLRPEGP